jgi:hypothetical protein
MMVMTAIATQNLDARLSITLALPPLSQEYKK